MARHVKEEVVPASSSAPELAELRRTATEIEKELNLIKAKISDEEEESSTIASLLHAQPVGLADEVEDPYYDTERLYYSKAEDGDDVGVKQADDDDVSVKSEDHDAGFSDDDAGVKQEDDVGVTDSQTTLHLMSPVKKEKEEQQADEDDVGVKQEEDAGVKQERREQ